MSLIEAIQSTADSQDKGIKGIAIAVVTNNEDKDDLGRIKVKYPWRDVEDETYWARVMTFMAGGDRGGYFLPEVGDEVVVAFENGDIDHPIVLGAVWSQNMTPPENNSEKGNNRRLFKSRSGHYLIFDDQDGEEKIEIIDKTSNNRIVIDSKENTITMTSDKDIVLSADNGKISMSAQEIEMNSSQATSVTAGADITMSASSGAIDGSANQVKLAASSTGELKAGASLDVKASGNLTLKGAMVMIN